MIDPQLGYDPDDQFYYSRKLLEELIPLAIAGPEPPARGPAETNRKGDPAEGGNMLAMILDVRRALGAQALDDPAGWFAVTRAALSGGPPPGWAVEWLLDFLGGPRPRQDSPPEGP